MDAGSNAEKFDMLSLSVASCKEVADYIAGLTLVDDSSAEKSHLRCSTLETQPPMKCTSLSAVPKPCESTCAAQYISSKLAVCSTICRLSPGGGCLGNPPSHEAMCQTRACIAHKHRSV